jgi:sialate O-acetylesterase
MNTITKLLAITVVALIIVTGTEAYIIQTSNTQIVRIACVGDSLTRGTEYTLFLWEQLSPKYIISDFGVGGTTASRASEKPYMNQSAFQLALDFQPNIVIIMLGTNDAGIEQTSEAFTSDYVKIITAFQNLNTKPDVFIVQPPPIYDTTALSNNALVGKIIPGIQAAAQQTGTTLIDANTPLLNHAEYFYDGIHPDADGARIIADTIYAKLQPTL